jgi:hypothetical protein
MIGLWCWAASAGADIYWGDEPFYGTVGIARASVDGSHVERPFTPVGTSALAINAGYLYFVNANATQTWIGREKLDGTDSNPAFLSIGTTAPYDLVVAGGFAYWSNQNTGVVERARLGGGRSLFNSFSAPGASGIAVSGGYLYWTDFDSTTIGRAKLDGSDTNPKFITDASSPSSVAVSGAYIYWANYTNGTIGRANLDGSDPNQSFISGAGEPYALALAGAYIYWTNWDGGAIGRASLADPSGANENFIKGFKGDHAGALAVALGSAGAGSRTGATPVPVTVHLPTTTTSSSTPTFVTVTMGAPMTYAFTLATATQPRVVSDTPGLAELNVPTGSVTFDVSNPPANILSHNFEVCSTPLPGAPKTLPAIQKLPNSCTGKATVVLAPGGPATSLTVDFTSPGSYEYLSTANGAPSDNDASSGMKGVLNVT